MQGDESARPEEAHPIAPDFERIAELTGISVLDLLPPQGKVYVSTRGTDFDPQYWRRDPHSMVLDPSGKFVERNIPLYKDTDTYDRIVDIGGVFPEVVANTKERVHFSIMVEDIIYNKLNDGGFAVVFPLSNYDVPKLVEALEMASQDTDLDFSYYLGTNASGSDLLLIGKACGELPFDSKLYTPRPGTKSDASFKKLRISPQQLEKLKQEHGGLNIKRDFTEIEEVNEELQDPIFNMWAYEYKGDQPITLSVEDQIQPGQRILYLSSLNLENASGIKAVIQSTNHIKHFLKDHPEIDYVVTLTWLEDWVKRMGMKKSEIGIEEQSLESEVLSINEQRAEALYQSKTQASSSVMTRIMSNIPEEFDEGKLGYYYCKRDDFKLDLRRIKK